jgi:hypothetical protein
MISRRCDRRRAAMRFATDVDPDPDRGGESSITQGGSGHASHWSNSPNSPVDSWGSRQTKLFVVLN